MAITAEVAWDITRSNMQQYDHVLHDAIRLKLVDYEKHLEEVTEEWIADVERESWGELVYAANQGRPGVAITVPTPLIFGTRAFLKWRDDIELMGYATTVTQPEPDEYAVGVFWVDAAQFGEDMR